MGADRTVRLTPCELALKLAASLGNHKSPFEEDRAEPATVRHGRIEEPHARGTVHVWHRERSDCCRSVVELQVPRENVRIVESRETVVVHRRPSLLRRTRLRVAVVVGSEDTCREELEDGFAALAAERPSRRRNKAAVAGQPAVPTDWGGIPDRK